MIEMLEADANNALRRVISGQGIHPSEFTLLSYGGSGPLHLAGCSRGIGFKDIITFQFAAAFSAFGCTTADFMQQEHVLRHIGHLIAPAPAIAGIDLDAVDQDLAGGRLEQPEQHGWE